MADIFHEVDEDLRHDRLRKVWDRLGPYVIALAVFIVVGTAGWRMYDSWHKGLQAENGDRFQGILEAIADGKGDAAEQLDAMIAEGSGAYPELARFRLASLKASEGQIDDAVARFDALSSNGSIDPLLRDLARMRAAYLLLDQGNRAGVLARVQVLAGGESVFRHAAHEVMALAALKDGDDAGAMASFLSIQFDPAAPDAIRNRAQIGLSVLKSRMAIATDATPEASGPAPETAPADAAPAPADAAAGEGTQ